MVLTVKDAQDGGVIIVVERMAPMYQVAFHVPKEELEDFTERLYSVAMSLAADVSGGEDTDE